MNRKEETKVFREWLEAWLMPSEFSPGYLYKLDDDGEYAIDFVRTAWEAWEARAALRASAAPEEGMKEASAAQHFDLKGKPAKFVRNGILETCRCLDCRALTVASAQREAGK